MVQVDQGMYSAARLKGICTVLGYGNGWLKYCVPVQFWGWAAEHFVGDSRNLAGMFLHNSVLYILNCSSLPDASGSPPGSAAIGGKFFYDIDGKVPFSYYERKPELYDLDGKHRFDLFRVSLLYQIARQESEEGDTLETAYKVTANKTRRKCPHIPAALMHVKFIW